MSANESDIYQHPTLKDEEINVSEYFAKGKPLQTVLCVDCAAAADHWNISIPQTRLWINTNKMEMDTFYSITIQKLTKKNKKKRLHLIDIKKPILNSLSNDMISLMRCKFFDSFNHDRSVANQIPDYFKEYRVRLIELTIALSYRKNTKLHVSRFRRYCICEETENLKMCPSCKTRYCSIECQRLEWPTHKKICQKV